VPNEASRLRVRELARHRVPWKQIAVLFGLSYKTLERHYREDLELGHADSDAMVARTAFRMATSGQEPAITWKWLERFAEFGVPKGDEASGTPQVNIFINTGIRRPGDDAVVVGGNANAQITEGDGGEEAGSLEDQGSQARQGRSAEAVGG
jgi:hypothetical protein